METLGQYLKRERVLRQITVEEISSVTKVNLKFLKLLESDDHQALPSKPFVKGFLKAYAKHLGLDETDVLLRYESYLTEIVQSKNNETSASSEMVTEMVADEKIQVPYQASDIRDITEPLRSSNQSKLIMISMGLLMGIAIVVATYKKMKPTNLTTEPRSEIEITKQENINPQSKDENQPSSEEIKKSESAEKQILTIKSKNRTWIKYQLDSGKAAFMDLTKEKDQLLTAKSSIKVFLPEPEQIDFIFNGEHIATNHLQNIPHTVVFPITLKTTQ